MIEQRGGGRMHVIAGLAACIVVTNGLVCLYAHDEQDTAGD